MQHIFKLLVALGLLNALGCLSGCSSIIGPPSEGTAKNFTDDLGQRATTEPCGPSYPDALRYQVGPGDVLEISHHPRLKPYEDWGRLRISKTGDIELPELGRVHVADMNVVEIRTFLLERLRVAGTSTTRMIVSVAESRWPRIALVGSVVAPGVYPLTEEYSSICDLISLAGGISPSAGNKGFVIRPTNDDKEQFEFDPGELFQTGTCEFDVLPRDGDTIYIPRSPAVCLYGEVLNPGRVDMPEPITLTEAIAEAGGLTDEADNSVVVTRKTAPGKYEDININLDAIEAGEARDLLLQDKDIVLVRVGPSITRKKLKELKPLRRFF